ncbi:MAG: enoyl-CoA hydratase-related protein [Ilumatobacteraceae bacterium]
MIDPQLFGFIRLSSPAAGVVLATLHRPEKLNAIDDAGHGEIVALLDAAELDDEVKVVVFTGAGRAFCAGGDITAKPDGTDGDRAEHVHRLFERNVRTVNRLVAFPKPIIAAVNGVAVGAGLRLAVMADISIVADDARLIDGHLQLGVTAGDHAALMWPMLCGLAKAKYLLMTTAPLDGAEAARMGLISLALPRHEVLDRAIEIAVGMTAASQYALRGTKRALNHWLRGALPAFEHSASLEAMNFLLADSERAMSAMLTRSRNATADDV